MVSGFNHFEDYIETVRFASSNSIVYDSNMTIDEFNSLFENGKCLQYRININNELVKINATLILNPTDTSGTRFAAGNLAANSIITLLIRDGKVEGSWNS